MACMDHPTNHPEVITFSEPRSKPDHDPHGEVNAHLCPWTCPGCGESGKVVADDLEMLVEDESVDDDQLRCSECEGIIDKRGDLDGA